MPHFSNDDIVLFETQLRRQRDSLFSALRQRLHQGADGDEMVLASQVADLREQAQADLLGDIDIGLLQIELGELDAVDAALARLHAGTYGSCARCAAPVGLRRLRAQPAARMCRPCQEALEKRGPAAPR